MFTIDRHRPQSRLRIACKRLAALHLKNFHPLDNISLHPDIIDDWSALVTTRYDRSLLDTMRTLDSADRFFYKVKLHRHRQVNIWCFRNSSAHSIPFTVEEPRC